VTRRGPQPIAEILADLMAKKGFGRVKSAAALEDAWRDVVGAAASNYTRVGSLRRGRLDVVVANSTLVQELVFQKPTLLARLRECLPEETIRDLRFRVGAVQ
jgi:predicted nucleic acid-binding Zn ribbon protein